MSEEDAQTVVIDIGSGNFKVGFGGDVEPRYVLVDSETKTTPIKRGIIQDRDAMENWYHILYRKLNVDPTEHPVLLTEALFNPKSEREKMISLMFDTFNVPSCYFALQPTLSLYSAGRTTGIVWEAGEGLSQIVPIIEGFAVKPASKRINMSGCDLTDWMTKLLRERGHIYDRSDEKLSIREMKEKFCYVALDFDAEMQKAATEPSINITWTDPNRSNITMGNERFRCPELIFKPYFNGLEYNGIDKIIFGTINKCDEDFRRDLYANIVLSGGTTKIRGLSERLDKEITALAPPTMKVKIVAPEERKYAAWGGGSILASLASFSQMLVTKEEYDECGPYIVHCKCII